MIAATIVPVTNRRYNSMKAIQITSTGGPEVLEYRTVPDPVPNRNEVLIQVHTSGVNFIDVYFRDGHYKAPLPLIPGGEGSGNIAALGADVSAFKVGDPVAWFGPLGSYAQLAVVPADRIVRVPSDMDMGTAAALMVQGATAYCLGHRTYSLKPGHTVLIHAAAGGVGFLLTQMAKLCGARVYATVSTVEKAELARRAGADEIIIYTQTNFDEEVIRRTDGGRVDVVYDGVGRATFEQSLRCLKPLGLLALYGAASGPVPPFDLGRLGQMGSLYITRPIISKDYFRTREELTAIMDPVFGMYLAKELEVLINPAYTLENAAEAHRNLESRKSTGKLVLSVGG
jgi:NADPH:quinone reductase